jgi:hypothetical protein
MPNPVLAGVDAMQQVCPWSGFDPGTVKFCEERLCAWVAEPSNAWSSLGYILVGLYMLRHALRPAAPRSIAVAAAQIMIGIGSFFFHASGIFWGELVDQVGMFMLSGLILAYSLAQLRNLSAVRTVQIYISLVLGSSLFLLLIRPAGIPLFALQLVMGIGLQLKLWKATVEGERALYRPFFVALGIFAVSFCVWLGDITGVVCNPQNHLLTGHAIWHILNALSVERLGQFYRIRFDGSTDVVA